MKGIDISNWQADLNLESNDYKFGIVKVTEGTSYTNPSAKNQLVQLTKLGKLIGCYHYARPDTSRLPSHIINEADFFMNKVSELGVLGKAIIAVDWEEDNNENGALLEIMLNHIEKTWGITPFVYCSKSLLDRLYHNGLSNTWPIWLAAWVVGQPHAMNYFNLSTVYIWQHTSTGEFNGKYIDLNLSDMNEAEWVAFAESHKKEEDKVEKISEDMQWCIDMGIFKGGTGDNEGKFLPKDYLTREQAATVIRRAFECAQKNILNSIYGIAGNQTHNDTDSSGKEG